MWIAISGNKTLCLKLIKNILRVTRFSLETLFDVYFNIGTYQMEYEK